MLRNSNYIMEMKDIFKHYGGIIATNRVNLKLGFKEVLGLVGDNAAGKSTLMKILSGDVMLDRGEIHFDGKRVNIKNPRDARNLGIEMVYQDFSLAPNLGISDNIFLGKEIRLRDKGFFKIFLNKRSMLSESTRILNSLGINFESMKNLVSELSGGQQQSIAIARSVSFNPKVLILDEPTASLAIKESRKVLDLVLRLKDHNVSVIIISHRVDDIFKVADRIMVLRRGINIGERVTNKTDIEEITRMIVSG